MRPLEMKSQISGSDKLQSLTLEFGKSVKKTRKIPFGSSQIIMEKREGPEYYQVWVKAWPRPPEGSKLVCGFPQVINNEVVDEYMWECDDSDDLQSMVVSDFNKLMINDPDFDYTHDHEWKIRWYFAPEDYGLGE